jgi:SAM-dependent methyltransferase
MNIDYNRINEIYNKFIVPKQDESFLNRYKTLPIHLNDGIWRWEHKDFPRVVALLEFRKFIEESNLSFKKVLTFNGPGDPELSYISYEKIDNYNYLDDPSNLDLHTLDLPNKDYDFFMTNQTLEHVYDPCLALKNIHKHLNVGGIFYCNVPAFNMAHDTPHHHYVGFTPVGLGCIIEQAGFEILDIGFWGNTEYITYMMNNNDWPDYTKVSNYSSEINKEVISWIFAKKI